tara:strand:+ start:1587 stop:3602 length:2016 start_codon:yes stop_codon:yes gene_type:complete
MARIVQFQTNFSVGELDPLLRARTDLQQYQNALASAENVTIQPQGGASRRPGLKFIYDFGSSFTSFKMIPFEYSVDDSYLLVVVTGRIYVFKNSVLQANINSSGNDYIAASAITSAMIDELTFTQAVDTLVLMHQDLQPQRLLRNSDTSWTIGNLPLTNIPKYAYSITTTAGNSYNTGTPHDHLEPSGTEGNITLTAKHSGSDANVFSSSEATYVGQYINVTPFGRLRIVGKVSSAKLECYAEVPLFDDSDIDDANWELEEGYENVWSNTRGWPRSAAFHEGRLYFGGSRSRPNTIWGSRVVDYFNFDVGTALDDEGVEATINTSQLNVIVNLNPGTDLQIFTTGGEFIVAQAANEPITPANFLVKPQSRLGSRPGIPIEDLSGATILVQRQGKALISFQFTDTTASYGSQPLSVLSSHLLNDPSDLSIRRATSTDETDRLFLVNAGDGSMAVYSILQAQNVIAPSKFTTDGEFVAVANELSETYTIVKRTVNSATVYYLEQFDESLTLDSAKSGGAASSVNMTHLEGKTVQVVRDGVLEPSQTVPASPFTITFGTAASSSYQVGMNYDVTIKTMPAEPKLAAGTVQGVNKRIVQVDAIVHETQNMTINGKLVPFRKFGSGVLGTPVQEFTGTKTVHGLLGFSNTGQITVSQTVPLKMTLLGLEYKMSVGN